MRRSKHDLLQLTLLSLLIIECWSAEESDELKDSIEDLIDVAIIMVHMSADFGFEFHLACGCHEFHALEN